MATFPVYAKILLAGFSEEADYGVLRSEMDGGIAKQRPRYSMPIVTRDAQIMVRSKADKVRFDAWVKTDINGGAGWFDWTDPLDPVNDDDSPKIKQTRIVGGKYKWTSPGVVWLASCSIETLG